MPRLAAPTLTALTALAAAAALVTLVVPAGASARPREHAPVLLRVDAATGRLTTLGRLTTQGRTWCLSPRGVITVAGVPGRLRYVLRRGDGTMVTVARADRRATYAVPARDCATAAETLRAPRGRSVQRLRTLTAAARRLATLRLRSDDAAVELAWSPDRTRVAGVVRDARQRGALVVLDAVSGREIARLADPSAETSARLTDQAFSPDGSRLVFTTGAYTGALQVLDLAAGTVRTLGAAPAGWDVAAWSPRGDRIAAYRSGDGAVVVDATTGAVTALAALPTGAPPPLVTGRYGPVWSPDGARLAFRTALGDESETGVGIVTPGRPARSIRLPAWTAIDAGPLWTPDGRAVYAVRP